MNWQAFQERMNNSRHITTHMRQGHKVFEIDCNNVTFKGRNWFDLSLHDKRKFETNLMLEHMGHERVPMKFLYS